jgi:hypothetical protein
MGGILDANPWQPELARFFPYIIGIHTYQMLMKDND